MEVNATLTNDGSNPIFDSGIIINDFSDESFNFTTVDYQTCSAQINGSQKCNVTFNITVGGGTAPGSNYRIFWNANWTDNNFSIKNFTTTVKSVITIESNPQITAPKNDSKIIKPESVNDKRDEAEPVIDDDFAKKVGNFNTLEELKKNIREGIMMEKEQKQKEHIRLSSVKKIIESSSSNIPEKVIDNEISKIEGEFKETLENINKTFSDPIYITGTWNNKITFKSVC